MVDKHLLKEAARRLRRSEKNVSQIFALFEKGQTVPYLAQFSSELGRNQEEADLWDFWLVYEYMCLVARRRDNLFRRLEKREQLTEEITKILEEVVTLEQIRDLGAPFRGKTRSKGMVAADQGLHPLAQDLVNPDKSSDSPDEIAKAFVDSEKGVNDPTAALDGAANILAEEFSSRPSALKALRNVYQKDCTFFSKVVKGQEGKASKYKNYFDYTESLEKVPSHRLFAVLRGSKEGMLHHGLILQDETRAVDLLKEMFIPLLESPQGVYLTTVVERAFEEILKNRVRDSLVREAKARAEDEALHVYQENLRHLLMAPPAGNQRVLGIDPNPRQGHGAAVDGTGKLCGDESFKWYLPNGEFDPLALEALLEFAQNHKSQIVAIGNGTGGRELERALRRLIKSKQAKGLLATQVNEAGSSDFASSQVAKEEQPDLSTGGRRATHLARRLQDPLAELVKLDPRHIGVGQYQHDIEPERLEQVLNAVVAACVNRVGVDLNSAPASLLAHVAGLSREMAQKIAENRESRTRFRSRQQLLEVDGMDSDVWRQCAGFLRVAGGPNPMDKTAIHPEHYPLVEKMAASIKRSPEDLFGKGDLVESIFLKPLADDSTSMSTLWSLREVLCNSNKDPRGDFRIPHLRDDLDDISDLTEDMSLEGVISNVTPFGAFVDVGLKEDGLVHVSEISHQFVKDPQRLVHVGQVVKVKVIGLDMERKRFSLSIKALLKKEDKAPRRPEPKRSEPRSAAPARRPDGGQRKGPVKGKGAPDRSKGKPAGKPAQGKAKAKPKSSSRPSQKKEVTSRDIERLMRKFNG